LGKIWLFFKDEEFSADEIHHGGGDDEGDIGHGVGDVERLNEPDGEDESEGKADEGDDGKEGELGADAVAAGGEDEPPIEGVGGEI